MPLTLHIRKAVAEDAVAVWNLRNAAILAQCSGHYPEDDLAVWTAGSVMDRFVQTVADRFYVATVEHSVAGTGMIDTATGHLDAIFVRPDMMGHGIGTQMMVYLENIAVQAGLKKLTLDSTLNAASFYRKCGFVGDQLGTYESPRGVSLPCIPMTKELSKHGRS